MRCDFCGHEPTVPAKAIEYFERDYKAGVVRVSRRNKADVVKIPKRRVWAVGRFLRDMKVWALSGGEK
jgi:hypothetical protein